MKNFFKKISDVAKPTAVLAIICIVVTLALSSTNLLTRDKIAESAEQTKKSAMEELVVADDYPTADLNGITYNIAVKENQNIALIFTTSAKGYGGDVKVMTAIDNELSIIGIKILDVSGETPGLGQNVTKESFYGQFKGKGSKINAVTGASISSKAVTEAVNEAYKYANEIIAKEDVS